MPGFLCTAATLKALPLFSSLNDELICAALPHLHVQTYPARACISVSGSKADSLCLILAGRVRVMQLDDCGREAVLEELRAHEFFNELGWLEGRTSGERYEAGTACTILQVPRALLENWLAPDAQTAHSIMKALAGRLGKARRKIGSLALDTVYARVVDAMIERGYEEHGEWHVDAGAEFIASLVGASREMVSRVVTDLISRGMVRRIKRQIVVPNRLALETYANNARTSMRVTSKVRAPSQPVLAPSARRLAA